MAGTDRQRRLVTAGVLLGIFLAAVDGTAVSVAMPTVVASLGGLELYSWVFTAYMLFTAVTMPLFGRLADIYGRKKLFFVGATLFVGGSVLCGFTGNMLELVVFRAIQGAGAGAMLSIPYTILGVVYPPEKRGKAIGMGSAMWGISSVVGPELGYFIVAHASWRWVFFLNVPVGVAAVALVGYALTESRGSGEESVDYAGAAAIAVGVGSLLVALQLLDGSPLLAAGLGVVGVLGLAGFALAERRVADPIVPLPLYRDSVFVSANATAFLTSFVVFAAVTYIPLFTQAVGGGVESAALAVIPLAVGWSGSSFLSGRYVARVGERRLTAAGVVVLALAFAAATTWTGETPLPMLLANTFFIGMGVGMTTPPLMTTVQNHLGTGQMGVATSTYQFSRNIGSAMGIAILGFALNALVTRRLAAVPGVATLDDVRTALQSGAQPPPGVDAAMAHGLTTVFEASVVVALVALVFVLRLPASTLGGQAASADD